MPHPTCLPGTPSYLSPRYPTLRVSQEPHPTCLLGTPSYLSPRNPILLVSQVPHPTCLPGTWYFEEAELQGLHAPSVPAILLAPAVAPPSTPKLQNINFGLNLICFRWLLSYFHFASFPCLPNPAFRIKGWLVTMRPKTLTVCSASPRAPSVCLAPCPILEQCIVGLEWL